MCTNLIAGKYDIVARCVNNFGFTKPLNALNGILCVLYFVS
jgi:hypothetical protein